MAVDGSFCGSARIATWHTARDCGDDTVNGQAGTQSVDLSRLFTGASTFWNIGPVATLPIFTGGFNYYTLQATQAQKERLK